MTTARIIHLDRTTHFPRLPACLLDINGEIYVDISSMLVTHIDRPVSKLQSWEFTYRLDKLPKNLQHPSYIWDDMLFVPLVNSLIAAQMVSDDPPLWVRMAEKIIAANLEQDEVCLGVHYGLRDLIESIYNAKVILQNPGREISALNFDQIMGLKLATILVRDSSEFNILFAYRVFCFVRAIADFFQYRIFRWA